MKKILFILLLAIVASQCTNSSKEDKISGAYEAMRLMSDGRAYPNLDIPEAAMGNALKVHQALTNESAKRTLSDPWEAMGPHNTAGRTLALAINPQSDSTVYLGSASGGLWRSRNLGLGVSWEYIHVADGVLGVSSIAFAEGDSSQMYIGTGEVYNNEITGDDAAYRSTRGSYGMGVFKSTDGGESWTKSLDWTYNQKRAVQSVQCDPNNDQTVYAATTEGLYKSVDAGENWTLALSMPMCTDIEIHRSNSDILIAAFGNLGSSARGIWRSTDGGNYWEKYNDSDFPENFFGKIELTSSKSNPNTFYASVGNGFSGPDGATWLFRSDDAGENWVLVNQEDYSRWQGWFAHDVAVHPSDHNRIMTVGIDTWNSWDGGINLNKASNGGVTLGTPAIGIPDGPTDYSHSDHHVALFHPSIDDLILIGNDGGLFLVENDGQSFRSANGGLQTTQFYNGFSVSHQDPEFALGGLQDNSTSIYRGTKAWARAIGGDGSYTGINFDNDNIVYASWQNLNVQRSMDKGENFTEYLPIKQAEDDPVFIAPYCISEANPDLIYAGTQFIYKSEDRGNSWLRLNNGFPLNGDPIFNIGSSPVNENIVMASTAPLGRPSAIFVSLDAGLNWSSVDMSSLPDRFVNDIVFDPQDESKVYIAFNGFGSGHLYVSENYGNSWTDISGTLPDAPGNAIAIDPDYPHHIYYGNDIAVYSSTDNGLTWETFQDGVEGSCIAMDLKVSPVDRKLWLATHGRGAFRRDLINASVATEDLDFSELEQTLRIENIQPNPVVDNSFIINLYSKIEPENLKISLFDANANPMTISSSIISKSTDRSSINIKTNNLPSGVYYINVNIGNQSISKSVIYL